jgi:hypothetical protein
MAAGRVVAGSRLVPFMHRTIDRVVAGAPTLVPRCRLSRFTAPYSTALSRVLR